MSIRNIMEDLVYSAVDEVLHDEKQLPSPHDYKLDIAAYVLNRVPPKYVTSERGILHGKLDARFMFQQRTDIFLLIHEALNVIKSRRNEPSTRMEELIKGKNHFFPHVIGEVVEETTFSIVPNVEVLMLFNGKPAPMMDEAWSNPYRTNHGTMGYYHFWPEILENDMDISQDINFTIIFNHPKFKSHEISVAVPVIRDFSIANSKVVPIVLLQLKDGVDISFLYE